MSVSSKNIRNISSLEYKYFRKRDLNSVRENGLNLQYIKRQTNYICLEAIENNWEALQFVKNQTLDICIKAYKINKKALYYISDHKLRYRLFEELINENIMYLEDVPIEFASLIVKKISQEPGIIPLINLSTDIIFFILKRDIRLISLFEKIPEEAFFKVICFNNDILEYLKLPIPIDSEHETSYAVNMICDYINKKPEYLSRDGFAIRYIDNPSSEMISFALGYKLDSINYIKKVNTKELALGIQDFPKALYLLDEVTEELLVNFLFPDGLENKYSIISILFKQKELLDIAYTNRDLSRLEYYEKIQSISKVLSKFLDRVYVAFEFEHVFSIATIIKMINVHPETFFKYIKRDREQIIGRYIISNPRHIKLLNTFDATSLYKLIEANIGLIPSLDDTQKRKYCKSLVFSNPDSIIFFPDEYLDFIDTIEEFKVNDYLQIVAYKLDENWFLFHNDSPKSYTSSNFPIQILDNLDQDTRNLALDFINKF